MWVANVTLVGCLTVLLADLLVPVIAGGAILVPFIGSLIGFLMVFLVIHNGAKEV
jgi:hypothetical protein